MQQGGACGLDSPGQGPALTCLDQLDTEGLAHLLHRGQQRAAEPGREMVELVEEMEQEMVKLKKEMAELEEIEVVVEQEEMKTMEGAGGEKE